VITQQPASAQFDGMPRSAIQTGLVSAVLSIAKMPQALIDYAHHPYAMGTTGAAPPAAPARRDAAALGHIMALVRTRCGFDFSGYKCAMLLRRVQRRMGLKGLKQAADYASLLEAEPREAEALYKDLLIGVTEFFRDPPAWEALQAQVIKPLVEAKATEDIIRVWVAGVATGEEAYSVAILLNEALQAAGKRCAIQIFASDTNEHTLAIARAGIYPAGIAARMSAQRLRRFFTEVPHSHHYQVSEQLRSCIVFCAHNLLRDPPYSKMDVVSCRNLLIYLEPEIQNKALRLMHFALQPGGYLFLGAAETTGEQENLFKCISRKWRIFQRAGATVREPAGLAMPRGAQRAVVLTSQQAAPRAVDAGALVQRLILERFAPAAVLTDSKLNALYFCGPTERFLAQPKGGPTQDLLALAREGLRSRLRSAIREAEAATATVVVGDARVRRGHVFEAVQLTVIPAGRTRERGGLLLVVFEDAPAAAPVALDQKHAAARLIKQLEEELRTTKEDLSSTIERQEIMVEELRTSNEEVLSANEELQSMNEELESAKEELQSLNEELNTVNQQLEAKISELESADSDLQNLLASSEIATVCLDADFRIRWYSPAAGGLFKLVRSDIGRLVTAFAPLLSDAAVLAAVRRVITECVRAESEVSTPASQGRQWYLRRILPYRTPEGAMSGAILTFTDITEFRRKAEDELAAGMRQAQSLEAQIEERMRLLRVELFKLATSEERERHQIAAELHDALCQPLAAAAMRLTPRQPADDTTGAAAVAPPEVLALISGAERAARALMYRISPPVLFDMGLAPALEWLAEEMQRDHHLKVNVNSSKWREPPALDETVRSVLFRCVRELLMNVAKHAKVDAAGVSLKADGKKITVRVSDAGVGFDAAVTVPPGVGGRFGLVSVRERLGFVEGTFSISSIPGDGTEAIITVPVTTHGRVLPARPSQ
jgi:two-component system CheB/CheR fusion protein